MNTRKSAKRILALTLSLLLVLSLVPQMVLAYDYKDESLRELWTQPTNAFYWDDAVNSLRDHHHDMGYGRSTGDPPYDIDALIDSELGESYVKNMYFFINEYDDMDDEVLEYWTDLGVKKEMHDETVNNGAQAWTSYTPLAAYEEENADKVYPVLFVYHGNNNPLFIAETYGFAQLVGEEEFICVMPWANNSEEGVDGAVATETDRIMDILREEYPIDESRIYGAGFSQGGRNVVFEALRVPGRFAAINPGGIHLAGVRNYEDFISDDWWEAAGQTAVVQMAGTMEMNLKYPYGIQEEIQVDAINKWFEVNDVEADEVTVDGALALAETSDNPVEQAMGLKFHEDYTEWYDGTNYYTGNYYDTNGVNVMRHIAIEGGIHWPTGSFAQVAWDYMSQFARDLETGELIVLEDEEEEETYTVTATANEGGSVTGVTVAAGGGRRDCRRRQRGL